ncbi:MAG: amino acid ABC transporter permease [Clostridiales bacterium]|jgi:polar amino acid transport system permease protein|nr:amino acid ABC transporter permease [Clostridiales bacterium]
MIIKFVDIARVLLDGIGYTLTLFFLTLVMSIPLGFGLTFLRVSRNPLLRGITSGYVWIMRGTPLLLQLFFFYYGLTFIPVIGSYLTMDRMTAAVVAFTLNYAAYFCEIFRSGLLTIEQGQYEAARVLGFSKSQIFVHIVLPQLIRVTLPTVAGEVITLVKDTALVTAIGVTEILYFAKASVNRMVDASAYIVAAVFYLLMNFVVTKFFAWLEKRSNYVDLAR